MADQPLEQVVLGPRLFGFFGVRRQQYRAGGYAITANQAGVADDHVRFVALGGMAKLQRPDAILKNVMVLLL